ncbi:MAG: helicase [Oscillospiraceae bacterium]|nr:helicase [Oscillospiraceae bacterium]
MSKHGGGKYWSAGLLFSRGWTNALMQELLPRPVLFSSNGRRHRMWEKAVVRAAELDPRFLERSPGRAVNRSEEPAFRAASERAAAVLARCLETEPPGEDAAGRLAGLYHVGILARSGAAEARRVANSHATAYLDRFLSLETGCDTRRAPDDLRNFLRALPWLGENLSSARARAVFARYSAVLQAVARAVLADFAAAQPEADAARFLAQPDFPAEKLLTDPLATVYAVWYVPRAIRTSLEVLVALNPKDEYPEARAMRRRFILHIGGTNTGKTYAGFQRLMRAKTGVYLAPLRLLALEAQETLLDAGLDCSLTTGEEEDRRDWDTHVAATAEKLDLGCRYEVAVIDECQMIADRERGWAWTRAILGVRAPEVHLCAAPEARWLLERIVASCGDSCEVELHQRQTPLLCMKQPLDLEQLEPGDALITFSKVGVLSVAEDLRRSGKHAAIIYGALPYATRRRQMEGFLSGQTRYVVSTDAIGMGLNLPIRRVIFLDTEKFDGHERRELRPAEIRQIAGRAGRYGMYDKGYVGATENLDFIRAGLKAPVPPLQTAVAGFSDLVLQVDFDLLEVLTEWSRMPTAEPYVKLDVSRYLSLISKLRELGFTLTRQQELRAANIPFDETDETLRELFFHFLRLWTRGEPVEQPELAPGSARTLPELEEHYRKLDLFFSFAKAFSCPVDAEALREARSAVAEEINEILLHRLRSNIRFCQKCGKALPLHTRGRLCAACWRKTR